MKKIYKLFLCCFAALAVASCGNSNDPDDPNPPVPPVPEPEDSKPVMIWIDASENFPKFLEKENVTEYIKKCKEAGITDLVVDVRTTSGEAMYRSKIIPEIKEWKGITRDDSWDYLEFWVSETHKHGLKVHANMNVLTGGQNQLKRGPVYYEPEKYGKWTSLRYTATGYSDVKNEGRGTVFLNPALPEVQEYVISIAKEIVTNYNVDGIMYDRCRFDNEEADWNDASKLAFETYVKTKYNASIKDRKSVV